MEPHNEQAAGEVLHQRGWRKAFTIQEMVDKWAWLVGKVEDGYGDMVDEYTNDLYSRNWLHEAWPLVTERLIVLWTPPIKALDDRFRAATVFDDGIALSQFHRISGFDSTDMWWWRRPTPARRRPRPFPPLGGRSRLILDRTTQETPPNRDQHRGHSDERQYRPQLAITDM